jgi:hypothetical protein
MKIAAGHQVGGCLHIGCFDGYPQLTNLGIYEIMNLNLQRKIAKNGGFL